MEDHHFITQQDQEDPCECTEDIICDKCLDYWVQKSHLISHKKIDNNNKYFKPRGQSWTDCIAPLPLGLSA